MVIAGQPKYTRWWYGLLPPQFGWCQSETASCSSSSLAFTCSTLPFSPSNFTSNQVVVGTQITQIRHHFGWLTLPLATPICNNHLFIPAKIGPRFTTLENKGLRSLGDLYAAFNLNTLEFFRYFQLRDFAKTHTTPSGIDLTLKAKTLTKGHIFCLYSLLSSTNESIVNKVKMNWESELQLNFSEALWEGPIGAVNSLSSCARLSFIQFKVLYRLHYSKEKLSRLYPDKIDGKCGRCSQTPCNLTHVLIMPQVISILATVFQSNL